MRPPPLLQPLAPPASFVQHPVPRQQRPQLAPPPTAFGSQRQPASLAPALAPPPTAFDSQQQQPASLAPALAPPPTAFGSQRQPASLAPGLAPPPTAFGSQQQQPASLAPALAPPPTAFGQQQPASLGQPSSFGAQSSSLGAKLGSPLAVEHASVVERAQNCPDQFMNLSLQAVPRTKALLNEMGVPLGLIVEPLSFVGDAGARPPVINFGAVGVIRCAECRAYINPFVSFTNGGQTWVCSLCRHANQTPDPYYSQTDAAGRRYDLGSHPELTQGCVEFVATQEYTYRPPQPPVYFFVLDVSQCAVSSGALDTALQAVRTSLDRLPDSGGRARVGLLAFDERLHFFRMAAERAQPQMLVVADLGDLFVPVAHDELLVNLADCRAQFEQALELVAANAKQRGSGFGSAGAALGPALRVAAAIVRSWGGKLVVLQCSLPSCGDGALADRHAPELLNSDREHVLLKPQTQFYKNIALDCSRHQTSIDLFAFAEARYVDLATLGVLAELTGGRCHLYTASAERERLYYDLIDALSRETAFEACMRVRCSQGVKVHRHYGNFFMKNVDLLATPVVDSDTAVGAQLTLERAALPEHVGHVCVQAALLYTTCSGERRIRVMTSCLPVSADLGTLLRTANVDVAVALTAKMAVTKACGAGTAKLSAARTALANQCVDIVRAARRAGLAASPLAERMPLYTFAITRHWALSADSGALRHADWRADAMATLRHANVALSMASIHPRLYALHSMASNVGHRDESAPTSSAIVMPARLPLSSEHMDRRGAFLLDNGVRLYLWLGPDAPPALIQSLLGVASFADVDASLTQLPKLDNAYSTRVNAIVDAIRLSHPPYTYQPLAIVKHQDPACASNAAIFFDMLIQDKSSSKISFVDFQRQINARVIK
jgi:protein transport protein SEC24